jgi:hypothetical protein
MKPGSLVASVFLAFIALAHLVRILLGTPVLVSGVEVPMWGSAAAALVTGGIALLLWRERRG